MSMPFESWLVLLSNFTGLSAIVPVLHHFAGSQAPLNAVSAPGKPAKIVLKLRFSCIMMMTC